MNKLIAIAGVFLISAGLASAKDLRTYKASYDKQMEKIILSHDMKMIYLGQQYTKSLNELLTRVKKQGDLDKTTAVMNEIECFRKGKTIPDKPSELLDIKNIQASYTKRASTYEADKAKRVVTLASQYDQALDKLQRQSVSTGKLDDAKAIQEERKRVAASAHVVQAKFKMQALAGKILSSKQHSATSENLLKNPSNEMPTRPGQTPGWEILSGNWRPETEKLGILPKDGSCFFFSGTSAHAELRQDIDVSSYRANIFKGQQTFQFEGYVSSWSKAVDSSCIIIEYLDKNKKKPLYVYNSGEHRSPIKWVKIEHEHVAPRNTYFIRVRLIAKRYNGKHNDGYFDALSLKAVQ